MTSHTVNSVHQMKSIREDKLRLLVESGSVKSAFVIKRKWRDMNDNTALHFMVVIDCEKSSYQVHTQKGEKRSFKTLDAADKFLSKNGIDCYTVS